MYLFLSIMCHILNIYCMFVSNYVSICKSQSVIGTEMVFTDISSFIFLPFYDFLPKPQV